MIHEETGENFIFVLDEWDCIFHKSFITDEDRKYFINWLATMTKDTGYVSLSYMTGVLPIAKYSSGSTINNFKEYSMPTDNLYSDYFGFTDTEVDELYSRYKTRTESPRIAREDLRYWYDGYHTLSSKRIYNPRSVVEALDRNSIQSYWTRTGPYSEISTYIVNDIDDVKKDVALPYTETPLLDYNDEAELTAIVNLVYLAARDSYYVERMETPPRCASAASRICHVENAARLADAKDKAGRGYVDFIFYPEKQEQDGIILELKVDDTPEAAIRQIKNRNYVMKFQGKMAEKKRHTGRILMVGIGYGRKKKEHRCKIEVL